MQSRPITEPGLITALQPISVLSPTIAPNLREPVGNVAIGCHDRDFAHDRASRSRESRLRRDARGDQESNRRRN